MKLLLDTHIWLRALRDPDKLSRNIRREIEKPSNELHLSPVSVWEAFHLVRGRRIKITVDFHHWLQESFRQLPVQEAPVTFAVAAEVSRIRLDQPDFGDLFLAATASVFDLTLATEDPQLLKCEWLKTI